MTSSEPTHSLLSILQLRHIDCRYGAHVHMYGTIYVQVRVCVYVAYMCVYVCVCVCVGGWGGGVNGMPSFTNIINLPTIVANNAVIILTKVKATCTEEARRAAISVSAAEDLLAQKSERTAYEKLDNFGSHFEPGGSHRSLCSSVRSKTSALVTTLRMISSSSCDRYTAAICRRTWSLDTLRRLHHPLSHLKQRKPRACKGIVRPKSRQEGKLCAK